MDHSGTENIYGTSLTAAKGLRTTNHAWPHEHVSNLTNPSIFDKGNYLLESVLILDRNTDKMLS